MAKWEYISVRVPKGFIRKLRQAAKRGESKYPDWVRITLDKAAKAAKKD